MTLRAHLLETLRARLAQLQADAASLRRFGYLASADAMQQKAFAVERRIWSLEASA